MDSNSFYPLWGDCPCSVTSSAMDKTIDMEKVFQQPVRELREPLLEGVLLLGGCSASPALLR